MSQLDVALMLLMLEMHDMPHYVLLHLLFMLLSRAKKGTLQLIQSLQNCWQLC